jgi:hypothetical protein
MTEIWHPCAGFETHYEVSNMGNVRSVERYVNNGHKNGLKKLPMRVLKPALGKSGYLLVTLSVDNTQSSQNVHRLVARAFIPNETNRPQVNHKNGIKTDNALSNLEWMTASENGFHSYAVLGNVAKNKPMFGANNPKVKPVLATRIDTGESLIIAGTRQKKAMGFVQTCVDKAIRESKPYKGWSFTALTTRITALESAP